MGFSKVIQPRTQQIRSTLYYNKKNTKHNNKNEKQLEEIY